MNSDATRKLPDATAIAVAIVIETRARDLVEGFKVRRARPSKPGRMVGPFIFLDQVGPEISWKRSVRTACVEDRQNVSADVPSWRNISVLA